MSEIDPCLDLLHYLRTQGINDPTGPLSWIKTADLDSPATATAYVNDLPDTPDEAMVLTRYSGREASAVFGNPFQTRHPRVQFMIRSADSNVALDRLTSVMKFLGKIRDTVINGTQYEWLHPIGEPEEIGPDPSDRQRAVLNMEVSFHDS